MDINSIQCHLRSIIRNTFSFLHTLVLTRSYKDDIIITYDRELFYKSFRYSTTNIIVYVLCMYMCVRISFETLKALKQT